MARVGILGAGIAGLSCAWLLQQKGIDCIVFEQRAYPGGLARSFKWHGFNCDFAAHRLFSKDENVLQQLLALVPMGRHIRRSRIYLQGRWLRDPLDIIELISHISPFESLCILWTYLIRPRRDSRDSFESYVLHRYGERLYKLFFQPYTEKLFNIPGQEISLSWARRKVRLASPLDMLRESSKTKFRYFYYPIHGGYGAISQRLYQQVRDRVKLKSKVTGLFLDGKRITEVVYECEGKRHQESVDVLISTLPLTITGHLLGYKFDLDFQEVKAVYLLVERPFVSDYHWIYFIDKDIAINRLVEFKNLSSINTPFDQTVLCAEVTKDVASVGEKVARDLSRVGLIRLKEIRDILVINEKYAYPVHNRGFEGSLKQAQAVLSQFDNIYLVGRGAEFKHHEIDDILATAAKTVDQILKYLTPSVPVVIGEEEPMLYTKKVFAVVLAYNNSHDTLECLASLLASDYHDLRIVLVDNGSTDGTPELVRERFPKVHVIENNYNIGVPAGYNVGFSYALNAGADYILMLNNDTIVAPDMVTVLVQAGDADPQIGILMPKVLYYNEQNRIWAIGGRYRRFPPAIVMDKGKEDTLEIPRFIEYAPSCGLLISRRAFELAGLFDPGYFFLFDDWDFSERVRAHGLRIRYIPQARMWHKVSRTTKGPQSPLFWRTFGESSVRFYRRHGRPVWLSVFIHVGYIALREFVMKGNWRYFKHFWEGILAGLHKPLGPIPKTKWISLA